MGVKKIFLNDYSRKINRHLKIEQKIRNQFSKIRGNDSGISDIDIHGSCVSRDIFNFDQDHDVELGKYFARNSFISAVSEPFPEEVDLDISSPWQKRMVENDLKKRLFEQLSDNAADYLLIDFIDERLPLMKYKNSIFTLSMELQKSDFLDDCCYQKISKFDLDTSFWKNSMDDYLSNLLKIHAEEHIIIHETYFVYSYLAENREIKSFPEDRINYYKLINKMLQEYYVHAKNKLPKANVLNIINEYNRAYENHRWGLSPVHYEDDYYKQVLNDIKKIISNG